MSVIGVVVIGCFAALFARLWYLQVMEAPSLEVQATANRTRVVAVEAPRGRILDRNGKVIVDNRTSLVVTVDRTALRKLPQDQRDALVSRLAATFTEFGTPTKTDTIEAKLADKQYDDLRPVPVVSDVSEDLMVYLSERSSEFPAVGVERESVRDYKYPAVAGNILGYVGRINAETLAEVEDDPGVDPDGVPKEYQPDSTIGLAGVEAAYEKDLRGTPGTEEIEIDAKNRPVRTISYQAPRPGNDIQLNIDIDVQMKAEEALREQLGIVRGGQQRDNFGVYRKNAPAGSVVVEDPNNGAVIALATYPSYDPAEFVNGISQERYAELTNTDGVSALIDRSITGQYAPGSTFKLVTATAALENGIITAGDTVNDKGYYEVGNPPTRFNSTGANGYISLPRALTVSSDVYFYYLGDRMDGTTKIQDTAREFGLAATRGQQIAADGGRRSQYHDDQEKCDVHGPHDDVGVSQSSRMPICQGRHAAFGPPSHGPVRCASRIPGLIPDGNAAGDQSRRSTRCHAAGNRAPARSALITSPTRNGATANATALGSPAAAVSGMSRS
jgi:penicillin-binding protein 2